MIKKNYCLALIVILFIFPVYADASIFAGEQKTVLLQEDIDSSDGERPQNPLLIELLFEDDQNDQLPAEAFDIEGDARLDLGSLTHNLSLKCGGSMEFRPNDSEDQFLKVDKSTGWYCFPREKLMPLRGGQEGELRIKLYVDTSWRLESGEYSIEARVLPFSIIPEKNGESSSKVSVESGNADIVLSENNINSEFGHYSRENLYYAYVDVDQLSTISFSTGSDPEAEYVLSRCLKTSSGCTWKSLKKSRGDSITSELSFTGLYGIFEAKPSNQGQNNVQTSLSDSVGPIEKKQKKPIDIDGKKVVGNELEVSLNEDNFDPDNTTMTLNGQNFSTFTSGRTTFTPVDPGIWSIGASQNASSVAQKAQIKRKPERIGLVTKFIDSLSKINEVYSYVLRNFIKYF